MEPESSSRPASTMGQTDEVRDKTVNAPISEKARNLKFFNLEEV